ncbi:MAG TPA: FAD-binding protein [Allosphingosinicella sp.]|nr:FAD-binding protein [Allosphingosinicella sp.]
MPIVPIGKPLGPGDVIEWDNYHKTGCSHLYRRDALRSGDAGRGREDIAAAARDVRQWLLAAKAAGVPVRPVGGAWSPSNIQIVQHGWMLNTRRFNRCFRVAKQDLSEATGIAPEALMLVEAGVQIDEINDKLESDEMGRSLRSTGASNGQTLAGACATATHGSVLAAGGIQDHVRAIQIVTPGGVFWIEPAAGLMNGDFIAETGSTETLRDDEAFEAALVAVGSLGIVTAMVIETVPRFLVRPYLKLIDFSREDLEGLARGDFLAFSRKHGLKEDEAGKAYGTPYFVMVVANPHKPFGKATVRFLYEEDWRAGREPEKDADKLGQGYDSFSMLGWALRNFPWARGWLVQTIMKLAVGKGVTDPVYATWGETTETHVPLADIFTGALFCDRADLVRAFETACGAFTRAGGSTAATLRFMKGPHGLLSPARWDNSAGIDFDGPAGKETERAFMAVVAALDAEEIPFTRHWGKFNGLDAGRVEQDYGDDLVRWKGVRDRLLPDAADRNLFRADDLDKVGLTL